MQLSSLANLTAITDVISKEAQQLVEPSPDVHVSSCQLSIHAADDTVLIKPTVLRKPIAEYLRKSSVWHAPNNRPL